MNPLEKHYKIQRQVYDLLSDLSSETKMIPVLRKNPKLLKDLVDEYLSNYYEKKFNEILSSFDRFLTPYTIYRLANLIFDADIAEGTYWSKPKNSNLKTCNTILFEVKDYFDEVGCPKVFFSPLEWHFQTEDKTYVGLQNSYFPIPHSRETIKLVLNESKEKTNIKYHPTAIGEQFTTKNHFIVCYGLPKLSSMYSDTQLFSFLRFNRYQTSHQQLSFFHKRLLEDIFGPLEKLNKIKEEFKESAKKPIVAKVTIGGKSVANVTMKESKNEK